MSEAERRAAADRLLAATIPGVEDGKLNIQARRSLTQRAAQIAAELPEDRDAALFLLARVSAFHALIFDQGL